MVSIESLKPLIVERLKPLAPEKIILFGSYARGKQTPQSDIDLFIIKDIDKKEARGFKIALRRATEDLVERYGIGFDFIVANRDLLNEREDYFYRKEIAEEGQVLYE